MYREHFGFRELPFSIAPDPRFLYMSEQHREAMAHLVYGMNTDGGFVLLTGNVGTGKTTICRGLLEQKREDTDIAFILNPKMSAEELLATICDELAISYPERNTSIKVFVDRINTYLLRAYAAGRKTVLIIEEAQNLRPDVLEQVRLLTNLETNQQKLLKIIMIGQPELKDMLIRGDMEQLSQRITARYHIGPLTKNEVGAYVNHRILVAGGRKALFPDSVISTLHRLSGGVPRLINVICDRALLGAYVQGKGTVDRKTLIKASREIFGQQDKQGGRRRIRKLMVISLLLASCGTAIAVVYFGRFHPQPIQLGQKAAGAPVESASAGIRKADVLEWPSGQPIDRSKEMAYRALFEEWKILYQKQKDEDVCKQLETKGLRCLEGSSSLKELILLNRPVMLKLVGGGSGKNFFVTLRRIEGQNAYIVIGGEKGVVDSKELEKRWTGEYLLLWKAPENYHRNIRPGDGGIQVAWMERYLASAQGKKPQMNSSLTYNDDLVRRVKKFQVMEGLIPDGIVGPQTIIHLVNKKGTEEPSLTADKAGGK